MNLHRKKIAHPLVIALLAIAPALSGIEGKTLTVTGQVKAGRAEPLAGATISLLPLAGSASPAPSALRTKEDGGFQLSIEQPDFYVLRVEAPGFAPMEHRLEPLLEDLRLPDVELARDAGLRIQVRAPAGQPLADVLVTASPIPSAGAISTGWQSAARSGSTGQDGQVRLSRSEGENLSIQAFRADLGESPRQVASSAPGSARALTLALATPHRHTVRALDHEGKPMAGVVAHSGEGRWRLGQTDGDGTLAVAIAPGQEIEVELHAADGRRGAVRLSGNTASPTSVELTPPQLLAGRLVSAIDGTPIRLGLVWPAGHPALSARSDASGKFTVSLAADGSWQLEAAASGFAGKRLAIPSKPGSLLKITLEPVLSLAGKVVEPSGRPVAGAEIRAFPLASPLHAAALCTSGADGAFRLSGLAADRGYHLEVHREGYGATSRDVPAAPRPTEPGGLTFILYPGRAAFGTIRDQAAKPLGAARVSLVPSEAGGMPLPAALSDQAGVFRFDAVPAGSFILSVRASGFAPLLLPGLVVPAGAEPWDLGTAFLTSGATIEGRVVKRDGSPVSGASVRVLSEQVEKSHSPVEADARATTDEEGRFTLADQLAEMPCRLEVIAPGFLPLLTPAVVPPTSKPITIVVAPSCQVSGTVLADGGPVAGAVVVAAIQDGSPLSGRSFYTASDADGHFLLQDLEPGHLVLTASAEGYAESRHVALTLPAEERRDGIEINLEAGGTVSGTVSSKAGRFLEGAVIEAFPEAGGGDSTAASRRKGVSDRAGHFRLAGLQPGLWSFGASHPEFARKVARRQIGSGDHPLDFVLASGTEIAGMVTDEDGKPIPGAQILLNQEGRSATGLDPLPPAQRREVVSQANGSFRLTGVEDGSYRLRASKAGFAPAEPAETIAIAGVPVEGMVLRLKQGSAINGHLLGLPHNELAWTEVLAFRADGRSAAHGEVDPTGGYHIPDLEPGPWSVVAETEETGKRAIGQVLLGKEPASLDLDFARGLVLSGTLRIDGRPAGGAVVRLRSPENGGASVMTQIEGAFRFTGLAQGSYSLEVEVPATGLRHVEEIDLSSDREVHLDLATAISDRRGKPRPLVVQGSQQPRDL
jgi:hypothetical protein